MTQENTSTSQFDPSQFLDSVTTDALTRRPPLPAGSIWPATISSLKSRSWTKKDDPSKGGIAVDIGYKLDISMDSTQVQNQGSSEVTLYDSFFLDTVPGTPNLDNSPGKNRALRLLREATRLNTPGQTFNLRMLEGRQVKVKIKHEPYEGEMYDKVDGVIPA